MEKLPDLHTSGSHQKNYKIVPVQIYTTVHLSMFLAKIAGCLRGQFDPPGSPVGNIWIQRRPPLNLGMSRINQVLLLELKTVSTFGIVTLASIFCSYLMSEEISSGTLSEYDLCFEVSQLQNVNFLLSAKKVICSERYLTLWGTASP